MKALLDVFNERQRQIDSEGWKPEHDDTHTDGELAAAASTYAWGACVQVTGHSLPETPPAVWPFENTWWKPSGDPRRNLVKAAALLIAEIERLDRAEAASLTESKESLPTEAWSVDGETFRWDGLNELLLSDDFTPGQTVYQGERVDPKPSDFVSIDALLDDMACQAQDAGGEFAAGFPDPSEPAKQQLKALIEAWATANCETSFFSVTNIRPYVIQQSDLEGN